MNKYDVLKRAKSILEKGPLPPEESAHGAYCPYCAIGMAKTVLDTENNTGLSNVEVAIDCFKGITERPSDLSLLEAKRTINNIIGEITDPFFSDKNEGIKILQQAIAA